LVLQEEFMKKLSVCFAAFLILAAMTACQKQQAAPAAPAVAEKSSYDTLMEILNKGGEDVLALSGVQSKSFESRANVQKALPPKAQKSNLKIGWAAASLGSEFFEGLMRSAKNQAREYGYTLLEQNANFNIADQQKQIDSFLAQGVDALVLNAVDLHSEVLDIRRAVEAGIPVFVTGPTAANPEYQMVTAVISGSHESGFQVGYYCAEQLYKPGTVLKVGMVISFLPDADSNSRPAGWITGYLMKKAEIDGKPYASKYDAILDAYYIWGDLKNSGKLDRSDKGLNFVALAAGGGAVPEAGQRASSDMLTANPDMDLLFVEMDSMCLGALQEVKQHGMKPGQDIKVVTCADGTTTSLKLIKDGEIMATATNIPYMAGQGIIKLIHQIFEEGYDANNLPATSFTPTEVIHAGNVDKYYDENDPFAKVGPWAPITIDEYNKLHANE
jgi:ribose transport system substrate-binding protein